MIEELPKIKTPKWLDDLTADTIINNPFPLKDLLIDSLYYPSAGFDGRPVKYLAGNGYSFIYVDYGHDHQAFNDALVNPGFKGYDIIGKRSVSEKELNPTNFHPRILPKAGVDGDPQQYRDWIPKPFCTWAVLKRKENYGEDHGPEKFSLLYLCTDGAAAYQVLYHANQIAPKVIAIIQPGHGFGGNWTNFEDPNQILGRSILNNPAGIPDYLLLGGYGNRDYYRNSCWPEYSSFITFLPNIPDGSIGLWARQTKF